jgi:hypothetical protein
MGEYEDNNEDFARRWHLSHAAVTKVAMMLLRQGLFVQVLPQTLRPDYESRMQYVDGGDLKIIVDGKELICEVKGLSREFVDKKHPFETAFLCNRWSFDNANPKPAYYFIVNKSCDECLVFDVKRNVEKIKLTTVTDRKRPTPETYEAYVVHRDLLIYKRL